MRRHGWLLALAVLMMTCSTGDALASRFRPGPEPHGAAWGVRLVSLHTVIGWLISPFTSAASRPVLSESPRTTALSPEDGWIALRFPLADHGVGVYLAVDGEAQFDVAYVDYEDGSQDRIELARASRGDGLFALTEFEDRRGVTQVAILARALTPGARIAVLLGR